MTRQADLCSLSQVQRLPRILVVVLAATVLAGLPAAGQPEAVTLAGLEGGELTPAELQEGTTVVVVWASWSPRCRDIVVRVNELVEHFRKRARVVTVNFQEEDREVRAFLAGKSLQAPVYLDSSGAFSKQNAISTLPGLLVIKAGEKLYRGQLSANPQRLIEQVLAGAG